MVAAGVAVGGGVLAPAAHADDKFVAISYSAETGTYGWGNNYSDLDGARVRSLTECQNRGGNHCVFVAWSDNGCAALATSPTSYYGWYGATRAEAEQGALSRNGGGAILVSECATGSSPS